MLWTTYFVAESLVFLRKCAPRATEFGEITQNKENKGHFAVQRHSMSPILVPIESSSYTISN